MGEREETKGGTEMRAPQIIMIVIASIGVVGVAIEDNTPRERAKKIIARLIGWGAQFALLWWGGFFG